MGYIDQLVSNHNLSPQERRQKYSTFVAKTAPKKSGDVVRIDLIRAMAFVGETNFSEEAQLKFVSDYNSSLSYEEHPCFMYRTIEGEYAHRNCRHVTYIVRLPKRGDKISEALIDDGSIIVGGSKF